MNQFDVLYEQLLLELDVDYTRSMQNIVDTIVKHIKELPEDPDLPEDMREQARKVVDALESPHDYEIDPGIDAMVMAAVDAAAEKAVALGIMKGRIDPEDRDKIIHMVKRSHDDLIPLVKDRFVRQN
mgnify:CR=1 FL=1